MGTGSFAGVKQQGSGVDHPPLSSAEVERKVELYFYTPSGPSWPVLGRTFTFTFTVSIGHRRIPYTNIFFECCVYPKMFPERRLIGWCFYSCLQVGNWFLMTRRVSRQSRRQTNLAVMSRRDLRACKFESASVQSINRLILGLALTFLDLNPEILIAISNGPNFIQNVIIFLRYITQKNVSV